ncbi:unnamed protein product [Lactuca virosa]|uniref:FBD domain-containing protein n=1 Tax=Lactuca virosa TaxID=75947 RepID=A0AAU9NTB2_9ASTR|nr:unnamed protein product [Lactuca virosa]
MVLKNRVTIPFSFLTNFSVDHFDVDSHSTQKRFINCFHVQLVASLKHLWLYHFQLGDLDQLHAALCLLRNSPNLESLHMILHTDDNEPRVDVGPASNHFETLNSLDCTLNGLKTVEIASLKGSKPEMLFIKLLLTHSPCLEKFTITPSRALNAKKILDIAKDVMQLPRASTKAKIFYLDPLP